MASSTRIHRYGSQFILAPQVDTLANLQSSSWFRTSSRFEVQKHWKIGIRLWYGYPNDWSTTAFRATSRLNVVNILLVRRKCEALETIIINSYSDFGVIGLVNTQLFLEFIDIMQNRYGKIEFKKRGKVIGYVAKTEIVWRNKMLHWIGCDHVNSSSNLKLLDLANQSNASDVEQRCPFDQILGYLDVGSLHSLSSVSKRSKQLAGEFVKRNWNEGAVFTITNEFHDNGNGCDVIAEHAQRIQLQFFRTDSIKRLLERYGPFSKVEHLVCDFPFEGYCFFDDLFCLCPALETLNIKNHILDDLEVHCMAENVLSFHQLKKFIFKCYIDEWKTIQEFFENAQTELIPTMQEWIQYSLFPWWLILIKK